MENHLNIRNEFVSYEIALALKELGFDEPVFAIYNESRGNILEFINLHTSIQNIPDFSYFNYFYNEDNYSVVLAPLYQQVIDWFREKYRLSITPQYFLNDFYCYTINDMLNTEQSNRLFTEFESYESAREASILKAVELIKTKEI